MNLKFHEYLHSAIDKVKYVIHIIV